MEGRWNSRWKTGEQVEHWVACVFHQQLDQSHCATLCLSVVKIGYIFIKTIAIRVHSNCGTRVTELIYVGTNNVIQWGDR